MTTLELLTTALRAVFRSGLLKPPGPQALYRIAQGARGQGANPATLLAVAAARWPHRSAVIDDRGWVSYTELQTSTEDLARDLYHRHQVQAGDAVGILIRNSRQFPLAVLATASIGADVVLLNTDFNSSALASAIKSHKLRVVLCDKDFRTKLATADPELPAVDPAASVKTHGTRPPAAPPGRIVLLTSGTTGAPKGVPRTPGLIQLAGVAATVVDRTGLRTGSRVAIAVPFFHAFGLATLMLTLTLGGTVITSQRFDAEAALAQASLQQAHAFAAVPIMLARILDLADTVHTRNPVPFLRIVISGGAPLDPALAVRFMNEYGQILYNGYGSSEVGIGSLATPADLRNDPATVGKPIAGSPVQILDAHDQPVPAGTVGRVFVGGKLTFDSYTGGARKPVVANKVGTGDMGYVDHHGRLYVVGREDDMIVSGGENVYPQAVENALADHPDIADNAVIGVPDAAYGQRLAAFVVPRADSQLDEETLRTYLKGTVSRFEQPRDIRFVTEIPRNSMGKIMRKELLQ